jgi:hypothetical protein
LWFLSGQVWESKHKNTAIRTMYSMVDHDVRKFASPAIDVALKKFPRIDQLRAKQLDVMVNLLTGNCLVQNVNIIPANELEIP